MNFTEVPTIQNPREFLVVILAGFGNELQPLTSNYGDQPCLKALLPIGNRPMISYVLSWVEEAGLRDVLLICPTSHRNALSHHINSDPSSSSLSNLSIEIATFDQNQDFPAGTAAVLAHFAPRITGDFVLLPCDFVPPPSLRLESVLNKFRVEAGTDGSGALATALFYEPSSPTPEEKGGKGGKGGGGGVEEAWTAPASPMPIVYDKASGTLLHVDTLDEQDRDADEMALRLCTLWAYPRATLSARLVDAHVYVCRRAVLDALLLKTGRLDSWREEFVPWLCKVHTQRAKRQKYAGVLAPNANAGTQALAMRHSTAYVPEFQKLKAHEARDSATSSPSAADGDDGDATPHPSLRVTLVVHRSSAGYAARANNIASYLELNRLALGSTAPPTHTPALRSLIAQSATVSPDSLIGSSTRVGERSTIKRSCVGDHVVIGKNVRISGCVLMEHCVVEDGARMDGCVFGKNTRVGERAEVVRCVTQAGYEVQAGAVHKHEKLDVGDWTAASEEEEEEEEEEEGGDD